VSGGLYARRAVRRDKPGGSLERRPTRKERSVMNLNLSTATRWGLNLLIVLAIVGALWLGRPVFIPTTIALLLAAMLWPGANYLNLQGIPIPFLKGRVGFPWLRPFVYRWKLPWTISCTAVVSILLLLALGVTIGFGIAIPRMIQSLPNDQEKAQLLYERFRNRVQLVIFPVEVDPQYLPREAKDSQLVKYIQGALDPDKSPIVVTKLMEIASYGRDWVWESILIFFILFFLLLEGRDLTRHVMEIFGPSAEVRNKVGAALTDMSNRIRSYLVWRTIINFSMALFLGLIYHILGLSQPWTWALMTAVLWYVPYLGPIMAGVPPVLDAFVSCDSPYVAIGILVFYIAFVILEGYFVVPVVMGRSMELNATTVMLACLFWELVWGTSGLFLAMPLMAALKTVCVHVPDWQPWANLMSTRDEPPVVAGKMLGPEDELEDTQLLTLPEIDERLTRSTELHEPEKVEEGR
jgi:AI-2 transport protein TqsA